MTINTPRIVPGRGRYAGQAFVLHGCFSDGPYTYPQAEAARREILRNPVAQEVYDDFERRGLGGIANHFITNNPVPTTESPAMSNSRIVHIVTGEHFAVPGCPTEVFTTPANAEAYALSLANSLRDYVGLPAATDPAAWRTAMEEARQKRAADLMLADTDELADEPELDGWVEITERVLDPVLAVAD